MAWARSSFGDLNAVSIPKRNTQYYRNSTNQGSTVWNRNQQGTSTGKTQPYGVNPRGDNNASYSWQAPIQHQKYNTSYPGQGPIQHQKNNNALYPRPQQGPTQEKKNNNSSYPRQERTQQHKTNTWQTPDKNSVSKLETLMAGYTANVIGVVIAKDSPRSIFSKKNAGSERFLVNFTLRDSVTAFVNVTCWGSENYIKDLCAGFCIGDIVKLGNVQVQSKTSDGSDEKFRAATPVGFHLTLSENHSSLALYDGLDLGAYAALQHLPTKPNCDYYTLEDVLVNGQGLNAEHINLLAVVRKIGPARDIVTKTGKKTSRCEIVLMDESCPSFPFVLWGGELVDFSQTWAPLTTVLFIADVRVNYDDFRSGMLATADSKTIITVNPDTMDAKCLFQFAQTQTSLLAADETGSSEQADPPVDQIQDVLVVEQIANSDGLISYGQLYGVITKCDLDADNVDQFYWRRWFDFFKISTL
ncbi:hypothetical protein DPMN_033196 [Dreissena polymorpha]|uniref:Uncharacterized protein n=1 Tax=Dreissena polymorpha TaxID=45954 RepID=A0A9D4M5G5_DREPO|nr:hypothetical protein DPMN_033196 [Dreissena polymorpha]